MELNIHDETLNECTKCHRDFQVKSNTYFRQCGDCREKWRQNAAEIEESEESRKNKLNHKKEYYQENKEEIRAKQKEHYDKSKTSSVPL